MHRRGGMLSRRQGRGAVRLPLVRSPSVPLAVRVGTRSSPRLTRAAPALASTVASVESEDDDDEDADRDYGFPEEESQPLLSPRPPSDIHIDASRQAIAESQLTNDGVGEGTLAETAATQRSEDVKDGDADALALARYFEGDEGGDEGGGGNEEDFPDGGGDDYCITDYTAGQYDIHERVKHFMAAVPISLHNRVAVEAAYMVEAVTTVRSMRSMRKTEIAPLVQDKYKSFIRALPLDRFADASVRVKMVEKYFRAKTNSADGFYTKACDVLKGVRALATVIKGVGSPLHRIPSGKSLNDMKNEFILKKYSEKTGVVYVPSNNDEELLEEIPSGWWLLNPSTNLLLSVLVHRCNPDIVGDPTEIASGQTRQVIREGSRDDLAARRERDKVIENHGSERQLAESSMMKSKAQLMAQTIDSGAIDQVKEQLTLLAQFKDSFVHVQNRLTGGRGEDDYDQTAHDLLSELPFLKKRRLDANADSVSTSTGAGRSTNTPTM